MAYRFIDEEEVAEPQEDSIEKFMSGVSRNVGRQAYNLGTRALGLPGDLLSLANLAAKPISESLTGEPGAEYEQMGISKVLPRTSTLRQNIEGDLGQYAQAVKPQNDVERFTDDLFEDTAMLLTPGGAAKLATRLPKAFLQSVGANTAGEAAKQITQDEGVGNKTKMGAFFLSSLINPKGVSKQLGKLYGEAESALPTAAAADARQLSNKMSNLKTKMLAGRPAANLSPSEKFVVDEVEGVERLITEGKIDVRSLLAQKRGLNERLEKAIYDSPGKQTRRGAKQLTPQITRALNETIAQYGEKNPGFYKPFKDADVAYGAIAQSRLLTRFAERYITKSPVTPGMLELLGLGGIGTKAAIGGMKVIPQAAGAALAYQGGKVAYRIYKSPALRKIYTDMLAAATKEDALLFNKYLNKLDDSLQEEESKDRYRFID